MLVGQAYVGGATPPSTRRCLVAALVGSILIALVGVLWRTEPDTYPFGPGDDFGDSSLLGGADAELAGWLAIAVGLPGALAAAGLAYAGRRALSALLAFATLQALVLGLLVPDIQILILAAYLLAFTVPPVLLGSKIRSWLGHPRSRWSVVLVATAVAAVGIGAGVLRADTIADLGAEMGKGFAKVGTRPLHLLLALAVATSWVGVVAAYVRAGGPSQLVTAGRAWIARWGVAATWVAAMSPLPYVLSRLTWLTPWPLFAAGADLENNPALRLMGIMLGLVAESCLWLTLGFIRPRGEVFPQWVPYVGGRTVPVMAAVIPGLTGAVLLTIAGRSLIQQALFVEGEGWILAVLPLWLWGPALGVATLAYWQRRRVSAAA